VSSNRMFRVIVLGGVALVAESGCGGSVAASADAAADAPTDGIAAEAGVEGDAYFPSELATFVDAVAPRDAANEGTRPTTGDGGAEADAYFPAEQ
jgi:hypothetical protein